MTGSRAFLVASVLMAFLACRPADEQTQDFDVSGGAQARENMPAEAVVQLDSGTAAFRDGDFEAALEHYTRFTELAPDFGAGWFGVYMTQTELGDSAAAAVALERARGVVPGATLLHGEDPDSAR